MKKYVLGIITCIFLFCSMGISVSADNDAVKLYLDISFKENIFLNKYDVDIALDGKVIDTMPYGKPYTHMASVNVGKHSISFQKKGDSEILCTAQVEAKGNCSFRCTIQTESKQINIVDSKLDNSLEGSSIEMLNVNKIFLPDAIIKLTKQGFINISYQSADGKTVSKESDWIVVSQSIKSGSVLDKNDEIVLSCEKITDFVSDSFTDLTISQAVEKAKKLKYEVSFIDTLNKRDIRNELLSMKKAEADLWIVKDTAPVSSNKKVAELYVQYTGTAVVPDVVQMKLTYALQELQQQGFRIIECLTEENKEIKESDGDKWKVIKQSIETGKELAVGKKITLFCIPYSNLSTANIFEFPSEEVMDNTESSPDKEKSEEKESEKLEEEKAYVETDETRKEDKPEYSKKDNEGKTDNNKKTDNNEKTDGEEKTEVTDSENTASVSDQTKSSIQDGERSEKPEKATVYTSIVNSLNIRNAPANGEIVGKLNFGDTVEVLSVDEDGWAEVMYNGRAAFVSAEYLQEGLVTPTPTIAATPEPTVVPTSQPVNRSIIQEQQQSSGGYQYVCNTHTKKFHYPNCKSVAQMKETNKWYADVSREEIISLGYEPCGNCHP